MKQFDEEKKLFEEEIDLELFIQVQTENMKNDRTNST
jgi:hypothetical protein